MGIDESDVTVSDCVFRASGTTLSIGTWSNATILDNVIEGGGYLTMELSSSAVTLNRNHFLHIGQRTVALQGYVYEPTAHLDFTNNYWGTSNPDSIEAWIWDGNDDPYIHAIIDYEPFYSQPIPTEKKGVGDIKAMFR